MSTNSWAHRGLRFLDLIDEYFAHPLAFYRLASRCVAEVLTLLRGAVG